VSCPFLLAKIMAQKIDIQMWLSRFQKAEDLQRKESSARKQALQLYTSTFFGQPTDDSEQQEVNFVYEFVDVAVSAIYARNPFIFVRTDVPARTSFADTLERAINKIWRTKRVKKKMKKAIRDAILQPPGWIALGFKFLKERDKAKLDIEKEFPELKEPNQKTEEQRGNLDETVKMNDIFINQLSSWDVVWPDGHNDIRKSPYIFVIERTNLEDVMNNDMLKKTRFDLKQMGGPNKTVSQAKLFKMKSEPPLLPRNLGQSIDFESISIKLIHVWDRRGQQMFTLAENFIDDTIFGPKKWEILANGFPQFPLIFNPIPQTDEKANSYPLSDITPILPQLKNLSKMDMLMMAHGKRQGAVILFEEGGLTSTQVTNLQNSKDLDAVQVNKIDRVKEFKYPTVPAAWFNLSDKILNDIMRATGMKQLVGQSQGVETATESDNLKEGSRLRQSGKIDDIEEFSVDVAIYLAALIWQFFTRDEISELLGEDISPEMWLEVPKLPDGSVDVAKARKIIDNDLNFELEAGSTQPPKNEAVERKLATDMVAIIKTNFPNKVKDEALLKFMLSKWDFPDIEDAILTNEQGEIEVAQKENALLARGIGLNINGN